MNDILNLGPEALTVAFLNAVGLCLKKIDWINDKYIPLLLAMFGGCAWVGMHGFTTQNVMTGFALGAGAVFVNQVYRQLTAPKDVPPTPPAP